ncbi:MAG: mechanosensitive ion channel family protein [Acidobacteria bacterium]|nr:MAG: mechanosensitive ion channel family protein [Acidobacteriota bacterium]
MPGSTRFTQLAEPLLAMLSVWGLKALGALAVLFLGWIAARAIRSALERGLQRSRIDPTLSPFLCNLAYYGFLALVVTAVLGLFGVQTASLVALLGAAGLALGLALQGTLAHFASGVMLLIFRPFQVGDFVEIGGVAGSVREIGPFVTVLDTPDNVRVLIPNSQVFGATIRNYTADDTRRLEIVVGVSYDDDLSTAVETVERVLGEDPRVLSDPAPVVAVSALGESSVDLVVRPWCRREDYWPLRFDLLRKIKEELEAAGCSIPYPQHDVHLKGAAVS